MVWALLELGMHVFGIIGWVVESRERYRKIRERQIRERAADDRVHRK